MLMMRLAIVQTVIHGNFIAFAFRSFDRSLCSHLIAIRLIDSFV